MDAVDQLEGQDYDMIDHEALRQAFCPLCEVQHESLLVLEEHLVATHPGYYTTIQLGQGEGTDIPLRRKLQCWDGPIGFYEADLTSVHVDSIQQLLSQVQGGLVSVIEQELDRNRGIKMFVSVEAHFTKTDADGNVEPMNAGFTSFAHIILNSSMIPRTLLLIQEQFDSEIEGFTCERSGWTLDHIRKFDVVTSKYSPIGGGTYLTLPYPLDTKHSCLLNIDNSQTTADRDQDKCFLWSVLAHEKLAGLPVTNTHRYRTDKLVKTYKKHAHQVNVSGLKFPMTIQQLPKFEKLNPRISLTVVGYDMEEGEREKYERQQAEQISKRKGSARSNGFAPQQSTNGRGKPPGSVSYQVRRERFSIIDRNTHLLYNTGEEK